MANKRINKGMAREKYKAEKRWIGNKERRKKRNNKHQELIKLRSLKRLQDFEDKKFGDLKELRSYHFERNKMVRHNKKIINIFNLKHNFLISTVGTTEIKACGQESSGTLNLSNARNYAWMNQEAPAFRQG